MNFLKVTKLFLFVFVCFWFLSTSVIAVTLPVAMITDKQGKISIEGNDLAVFSEIDEGSLLEISKGAKLTLVYLESGQEFFLKGPLSVKVGKISPSSNNEVIKSSNILISAEKVVDSTAKYSQAAIVMRSGNKKENPLKIIQPQKTKILHKWPQLSWKNIDKGYNYRVEILSATGDSLYVSETKSNSLQVPKQINLPENALLTWEIEATRGMSTYYNSADFMIADKKTADAIKKAQPAGDKFSQLAFYARTLEKKGFKAEARKYWLKLDKKRPGSAAIQAKLRD